MSGISASSSSSFSEVRTFHSSVNPEFSMTVKKTRRCFELVFDGQYPNLKSGSGSWITVERVITNEQAQHLCSLSNVADKVAEVGLNLVRLHFVFHKDVESVSDLVNWLGVLGVTTFVSVKNIRLKEQVNGLIKIGHLVIQSFSEKVKENSFVFEDVLEVAKFAECRIFCGDCHSSFCSSF